MDLPCRLCSSSCSEFQCLFQENGETSDVYQVAVKYFNPSLFFDLKTKPTSRVICLKCWQHIDDFHNFQQWILDAQGHQKDLEFFVHIVKPDEQMSTSDISDFNIDTTTTNSIDSNKSITNSLDLADDKNIDTTTTNSIDSNKSITNSLDLADHKTDDVLFAKINGKFKCFKCKKIFSNFLTLDIHFRKFHPNLNEELGLKRLKCETCGASFSQYTNLRRHVRRKHTLQSLFKCVCKHCNKTFKSRAVLERHKCKIINSKYNDELKTKLPQCNGQEKKNDEEFVEINIEETNDSETDSLLDQIISEISNENNNNQQNSAQTLYNTQSSITEEEIANKSDALNFKVKLSSTDIQPNGQIQMPALDIVDIKKEFLSDEESELDTSKLTNDDNSNDLNSVTEEKQVQLECPRCNKHISNYSQLIEHFASEHPKERCFISCCQMMLYGGKSITEHFQYHKNPTAFECPDCGKCFTSRKGLSSHKRQVHTDNRSAYHLHQCYCKRAQELLAENKSDGSQYDRNVCCQRKKKILKDDALIAMWKKELTCEICESNFSYYSLMRAHFYFEHPGEKCFISCCQRKMSRISDVLDHIRIHVDPHAYQCKICKTKFSAKNSLTKHIRNAHNDSLPKQKWACDECDKSFAISQILTRHKNVHHSKKF